MFTHQQVWNAIDRLAAIKRVSVSRLALLAGLDATALNISKRVRPDGMPRWPSTETLSKLLAVAGVSLAEFCDLVGKTAAARAAPQPTPPLMRRQKA